MSCPARHNPSVDLCLAALLATFGTNAVCTMGAAQGPGTGTLPSIVTDYQPFADPWAISLSHVRSAMLERDFTVRQVRRVLDLRNQTGTWTGIIELLQHAAPTATQDERFQLKLMSLENRPLTPAQFAEVDALYRTQVSGIYHDLSFRVVESEAALRNYQVVYVNEVQRAGRAAYRTAVLPRLPGRSIWLLDLDQETGYPLYRGEIDLSGRLVSEIEVTHFAHGIRAGLPSGQWWWTPPADVREFTTPTAAVNSIPASRYFLPAPDCLPPGYVPTDSRVLLNAYGQDPVVTLAYTDGVDTIFVIQMAPSGAPLVAGHSIGVQRQDGLTRYFFRHKDREVHVLGKAAEPLLRMTTETLYRQVLR